MIAYTGVISLYQARNPNRSYFPIAEGVVDDLSHPGRYCSHLSFLALRANDHFARLMDLYEEPDGTNGVWVEEVVACSKRLRSINEALALLTPPASLRREHHELQTIIETMFHIASQLALWITGMDGQPLNTTLCATVINTAVVGFRTRMHRLAEQAV